MYNRVGVVNDGIGCGPVEYGKIPTTTGSGLAAGYIIPPPLCAIPAAGMADAASYGCALIASYVYGSSLLYLSL